jgi:murein DD-endopeptidase MepM/ murein hydrolase activator NlpD
MRKSILSTITLATLLCLSTNNYALVGSAFAANKSAVSPDVNFQSRPSAPSNPSNIEVPAIAPANARIEIQSEFNSKSVPANLSIDNREPVQVNIETASKTSSPKLAPNLDLERSPTEQPATQPVEIVLENRSTGCKFKASSLLEIDADLCNPKPAIAAAKKANPSSPQNYTANGEVLYAAANGETAMQVRRLTAQEIAAMSVPSNGDKQMIFPLIAPSIISSLFGSRVHPVTGQIRFHQGTDLAAAEGTPVVAAFSGRVEIAGQLGGYGLIVVLSHGDTHETRYAHLSEILVKAGQEIRQGTVIGLVGSTGLATGPHLHFEIWRKMQEGLVAIDPTPQLILAMEQLEKYLAQSPKSGNKA